MARRSISLFGGIGNAATVLALLAAAMLSACATAPAPPPPAAPAPDIVLPPEPVPEPTPEPEFIPPERQPAVDEGVTPPHMEGRNILRAALLLPFSSGNSAARREAEGMLNAAELGLFEHGGGRLLLIPKDTGGTSGGAEAAARAAVREGADVILGPLFAQAVSGAGAAARPAGVPVIAFSTDHSVAGRGVYLLSFAPEAEVRRAAGYAAAQGVRSIALLGPATALTTRIEEVLQEIEADGGPAFHGSAIYSANDFDQAAGAVQRLASARAAGQFQAVFVSDTVDAMGEMTSMLQSGALTAQDVLMFGPGSWRGDPAATINPAMRGALIAGADDAEQASFAAAYERAFGDSPSQLASLAFDAVALAGQLRGDAGDWDIIENPQGYLGADGLFRLPPSGVAERGLAVYELGPAGFMLAEPAPGRFDLGF